MIIGITGDIDKEEITKSIRGNLGKIKPGTRFKRNFRPNKRKSMERVQYRQGIKSSILNFYIETPGQKYREKPALDLLNHILCGSEGIYDTSNRLNIAIRKKNLAYGISSQEDIYQNVGLIGIRITGIKEKNLEKVKGELLKEIELLKKYRVPEKEFNAAKDSLLIYKRNEMEGGIEEVTDNLVISEMYQTDYRFREYRRNIRNLTSEDIMRVAKKILRFDNCSILSIQPLETRLKVKA